jgi:hypothetical protein
MSEKLVEKVGKERVERAKSEADLGKGIMGVGLEKFATLGSYLEVNTGS